MDTEPLVRDYLGRLDAAASALPLGRRAELAAEVREHIDAALAEAGRTDEVTVRNILERLGSPEEIVAGEAAPAYAPSGAVGAAPAAAPPIGAAGARSKWGAVEVAALVMLTVAWVFYPSFGVFWWLGFGVVGLVLIWSSGVWRRMVKAAATAAVIALYLLVFAVFFQWSANVTPVGGPEPIVVAGQTP